MKQYASCYPNSKKCKKNPKDLLLNAKKSVIQSEIKV